MLRIWSLNLCVLSALALAAAGCNSEGSSQTTKQGGGGQASGGAGAGGEQAESGHPTEGPHHGSLIELGNEEYHAELVHDEKAGKVTIYILGKDAKTSVPADDSATINAVVDRVPKQFKLSASPNDASQFTSTDAALGKALDNPDSNPTLSVTIAGKKYKGKVAAHDHGHDHEH